MAGRKQELDSLADGSAVAQGHRLAVSPEGVEGTTAAVIAFVSLNYGKLSIFIFESGNWAKKVCLKTGVYISPTLNVSLGRNPDIFRRRNLYGNMHEIFGRTHLSILPVATSR